MPRLTLTPADTTATSSCSAPPSGDTEDVALGSFAAMPRKAVILSIQADYSCLNVGGNSHAITEYSFDGASWTVIRDLAQIGAGSTSLTNQADTVTLGDLTATQVSGLRVRAHTTATSAVSDADSDCNIDTWSVTYLAGPPGIFQA